MLSQQIKERLLFSKDPEQDLDPAIDHLLREPALVRAIVEDYYQRYRNLEFNKLCVPVGIGLAIGGILAYRLNVPLVTVYSNMLAKEGEASFFCDEGALEKGDKALLHDDLLGDHILPLAQWINDLEIDLVAGLFVAGGSSCDEDLLKVCGSIYVQASLA